VHHAKTCASDPLLTVSSSFSKTFRPFHHHYCGVLEATLVVVPEHTVAPTQLSIEGVRTPFQAILATDNTLYRGVGMSVWHEISLSMAANPNWKVHLPPAISFQHQVVKQIYIRGTRRSLLSSGHEHSNTQPIISSLPCLSLQRSTSSINLST
jgi:hypothetical protein